MEHQAWSTKHKGALPDVVRGMSQSGTKHPSKPPDVEAI